MRIHFDGDEVAIVCPAKVNLFLEILGKRQDGYHEIETVMCPISLCDRLVLRPSDSNEIRLAIQFPDPSAKVADEKNADPAWQVPADGRNLVVKAVELVRRELGIARGCRIELEKLIPAGAGLGGGSSNAAAAIVASLVAWNAWDRELANCICARLGSDLNFFLGDANRIGIGLATGRGEKCQIVDASPALDLCVTHPPEGCPTARVYANLDAARVQINSADEMIQACVLGDCDRIGKNLYNALTPAAQKITRWIDRQHAVFNQAGARYSAMSGSGSSCFALLAGADTMADIRRYGSQAGLQRVYAVKSWFARSVEEQIRLANN